MFVCVAVGGISLGAPGGSTGWHSAAVTAAGNLVISTNVYLSLLQ